MSRIGKMPVKVPAGVKVTIDNGTVKVAGSKGELTYKYRSEMNVTLEGDEIIVARPNDAKENRALHGLTRTLLFNMVQGVSEGYQKTLALEGTGYRAQKQGDKVILSIGYSHPVEIAEEAGITLEVPAPNRVVVKGIDKQRVGEVAAVIRRKRPPEPYHGKGIRYEGEYVKLKAGKTGAKK